MSQHPLDRFQPSFAKIELTSSSFTSIYVGTHMATRRVCILVQRVCILVFWQRKKTSMHIRLTSVNTRFTQNAHGYYKNFLAPKIEISLGQETYVYLLFETNEYAYSFNEYAYSFFCQKTYMPICLN